jgi:hypothetical protein
VFGRNTLPPTIVYRCCALLISAPPTGSLGCNSVGVPAGDESSVRSLSADNAACAADGPNASADPLDFLADL